MSSFREAFEEAQALAFERRGYKCAGCGAKLPLSLHLTSEGPVGLCRQCLLLFQKREASK